MKTFYELSENVKTADRKPEIYTKPDGKKGVRMVAVDKEVIKQEKTLEWLKASLAREAKKVKPRQDDMEEAYEQTMYCKKCGCERGDPDPDCSCKMENASLTDAQCYSEQSKCGSVPKKEGVNELTIADVQKATAMAKKRQAKEREAGKKSVSTTDLGARMPKKEATIPDGQTAMTKTPAMKDKDKKTMGKIADLMKRANEDNEKDFKPHMMYDPKTGKGYKANKYADHVRMNKMGYTHDDPSTKKKEEGVKSFAEISKGMASRYIKKAQVSTADAAKSTERGYTDSRSPDRGIATAGKAQTRKGIKTFINRNKGTSTAVDKLTGKAKVPAREGMAQDIAKQKIDQEKEMDAKRHDRMMDKARTKDTKTKNMSELSMSMKALTKTGLNKNAHPDKDKIRKGLDALKKAGNAKADAESGERRKKMSELSNNKMGQYVRKAADDAAKKGAAGDTKKAQARVKGVSKAMDKIDHNRLFGRQG